MPQTYINRSAMAHRRFRKRQAKKKESIKTVARVKEIAQKVYDKNVEYLRLVDTLSQTSVSNITVGQPLWKGPLLSTIQPSPTPTPLNVLRKGEEIQLRKLKFNLMFKSIGASDRVRIVLIKYPQLAGATNNLTDVLQDVTAQHVMISPWKKNGNVKYQILHNQIYNIGTKGVMDGTYKYQSFKFSIRFGKSGLNVHYADATVNSPDRNSLLLMMVADQAPASPNGIECWAKIESVFTDS